MREPVPSALPADYHTHTFRCRHAKGEAIDYARAAEEAGLPEIACTDHIPFPGEENPSIRMTEGEFGGYLEAVAAAREGTGIPVLLGMEADYTRELAAARWVERLAARGAFDVVLGSVHTGPYWDFQPGDPSLTEETVERVWREYFAQYAEMARTGLFDVGSHFDLPKRRGVFLPEAKAREILLPALDAVAEAGMALEINTSGWGHGCKAPYPGAEVLRWMRERDIGLVFGSDAHRPDWAGRWFAETAALAKESGYTEAVRFRGRRKIRVPLA